MKSNLLSKELKIKKFIDTIKKRRSNYSLMNDSILKDDELIDFIKQCIHYHPSPFNVQSTRVIVLFHDDAYKLWDFVLNQKSNTISELLKSKLTNYRESYLTLLFFNDEENTNKTIAERHVSLESFNSWTIQSMAMLQITIWNGLTYFGYGVNIQHFNNELVEYVKQAFNHPNSWKLLSQMNIGLFSKESADRTYLPIDKILTIHNS